MGDTQKSIVSHLISVIKKKKKTIYLTALGLSYDTQDL